MRKRTLLSPTVGALLYFGLSTFPASALASPVFCVRGINSDANPAPPAVTKPVPVTSTVKTRKKDKEEVAESEKDEEVAETTEVNAAEDEEEAPDDPLPLRNLGSKLVPVPAPFTPEDFGATTSSLPESRITIVDSPEQILEATKAEKDGEEQQQQPEREPEPAQTAVRQDGDGEPNRVESSDEETSSKETGGTNGDPDQVTIVDDPSGEMVFGLKINGVSMVELVTGLDYQGKYLIGLGSLSQAFEFPIVVSADSQGARGWFIRERNSFKVRGRTVILRGNSRRLGENDIVVYAGDIYINADILGDLLGLTFAIDLPSMMLDITSEIPLPFEEKLRREKRGAFFNGRKPETPAENTHRVDDPYLPYEFPYMDFSVMSTFQNKEGERYRAPYSLLSKGDLAYLTTEIFLSGDLANGQVLGDSRFNFSRADDRRGLLGPLHASQIEFGDVESSSLSLVATSSSGRGVRLSNRSLYRADQMDAVTLRGVVSPGWDAELYRNGALIDIQTVSGDGKYEFVDVPIYLGRNSFRVVLYGPRGEIREETKEYYAGSVLLEGGDATYNFSITDNNKSLTGAGNSQSASDGMRMLGEVEYGVSKWLTLAGGFGQIGQANSTYHYLTSGLRAGFGGVLGSLDAAFVPDNSGSATRLSLAANYWDIDMSLQQSFYRNYVSDVNSRLSHPLSQTTNLILNTPLNLCGDSPMTLGFSVLRNNYVNGDVDTILRNTVSQSLWGVSVTNTLERDYGTNAGINGTLTMRAPVGRVNVGVSTDYTLRPESELDQVNLTSQYYWTPKVLNRFTFSTDVQGDYDYNGTLVLDRDKYSMTLFAGNNSDHAFYIGVGINFSFNKLPDEAGWHFQSRAMADSGGVAVDAFLDSNANGLRDSGEEALSGVGFKRGGQPIAAVSDTMAFVAPLAANNPTRVSLDESDLGDPMRGSVLDGWEVLPRPGHTTRVSLPIVEMSMVEGTVSSGTGEKKDPAGYVRVELVAVDGSIGSMTTSEFDGYYLFEKVMPGTYTLRVTAPDGSSLAGATASRQVEINTTGFYTFDLSLPAKTTTEEKRQLTEKGTSVKW